MKTLKQLTITLLLNGGVAAAQLPAATYEPTLPIHVAPVTRTDSAFLKPVLSHLSHYPEEALQMQKEGVVVVEGLLEPSGYITQAKVTQKLGLGLDEEAIRIVTSLPIWRHAMPPGRTRPRPIKVPVAFKIE